MPGGKGRSRRRKSKGQERDVSFRFYSSGSLESGAYLSEGKRDSPVFSDSLDELDEDSKYLSQPQSDNEDSSRTSDSVQAIDQKLVSELLESAIDDTESDGTHFDHPLSDQLFEFDQEPLTHQELDKNTTEEEVSSIQTRSIKKIEYKEATSIEQRETNTNDSSGFLMNIPEKDNSPQPNDDHRLLDSDDEELFFSLSRSSISIVDKTVVDDEVTNQTETNCPAVKNHEIESDSNDSPAIPPFKDNTTTSDSEDATTFAEVDTHPLLPSVSVEKEDEEVDGSAKDEDNHQILLSEEHFSKIPAASEPNKNDENLKVKPKRPPPPRPPLPSKMGKPSIVVNAPTDTEVYQTNLPSTREESDKISEDGGDSRTVQPDSLQETVQFDESMDETDQKSSEVVQDDSLSLSYFIIYTLIVFLYYSLNPSSYLAGFLTGFLLFFVTSAVAFIWYVNNLQSFQEQEREAVQQSLESSSQQFINQLGINFEQLTTMKVHYIKTF